MKYTFSLFCPRGKITPYNEINESRSQIANPDEPTCGFAQATLRHNTQIARDVESPATIDSHFFTSKNSRGRFFGKLIDTDSRIVQILTRDAHIYFIDSQFSPAIRVYFMAYNEPYKRITMNDFTKTAVITIKIINVIDSKFDRFRK